MKKNQYQKPRIEVTEVVLEGMLAASLSVDHNESGAIEGHVKEQDEWTHIWGGN